jgi:hypothetical protein
MKKHINNEKVFKKFDFGLGANAVSHTETTGLIPSLPQNEQEIHSYKEIDQYSQKPITEQV